MATITDQDLVKKCRKSCEKISENMYIIGNEPTLACYRIQEHVHKSGPMIIDKGAEMRKLSKQLQGCCYGLDYSVKAIKSMEKSSGSFQSIQELLKNSVFVKQQLNYEESLKQRLKSNQPSISGASSNEPVVTRPTDPGAKRSPFQRFSGSFDIPSFTSPFAGGSIVSQLRGSASHSVTGLRQNVLTRHQTVDEYSSSTTNK